MITTLLPGWVVSLEDVLQLVVYELQVNHPDLIVEVSWYTVPPYRTIPYYMGVTSKHRGQRALYH